MPPKKKLTRYDAAYDHLGRGGLGFTKKVIRAKIDSLLKVYGADGWIFIEDASYKMLIECLLEEQEKLLLKGKEEKDQGKLPIKEKEQEDQQKTKLKEKEEEEGDQKSEEQLPRKISTLSEIEKRLTEIGRFSSIAETSKVESEKRITESGRFASVAETSNTIEIPEPTEVETSEPTGTEIPQRCIRRPCFGFYDSDDGGEDDCEENYVYYETKASLRERMARGGLVTPRKERKSRWDVVGV